MSCCRRLLIYLKYDAEGAFVVAGAGDAEVANFGCAVDVGAYAGTYVVVADAHEAQCLGGIGGQLVYLYALWYVVACDEFKCDGQVLLDKLVDGALDVGYLLWGGAGGELIVDFRFLALYVHVARASAVKHAVHGLIEQMLGCVGWWKLLFVVFVKYGGNHCKGD